MLLFRCFRGAMLGFIFDNLGLILDVFSPIMSISFIFIGAIFVQDFSNYRGLNFTFTLELRVFYSWENVRMLDFGILCGAYIV